MNMKITSGNIIHTNFKSSLLMPNQEISFKLLSIVLMIILVVLFNPLYSQKKNIQNVYFKKVRIPIMSNPPPPKIFSHYKVKFNDNFRERKGLFCNYSVRILYLFEDSSYIETSPNDGIIETGYFKMNNDTIVFCNSVTRKKLLIGNYICNLAHPENKREYKKKRIKKKYIEFYNTIVR